MSAQACDHYGHVAEDRGSAGGYRCTQCGEGLDDEDLRLLKFLAVAMRCPGSPADGWPCGDCCAITETDARGGRRVLHLRTCEACRARGAPDTLPW